MRTNSTRILVSVVVLLIGTIYGMRTTPHQGVEIGFLLFIISQLAELQLQSGFTQGLVLDRLKQGDKLTDRIGTAIEGHLKTHYKASEGAIKIGDQDGIFLAYKEVWRLLVKQQKKLVPGKAIHVDVVHATDPAIWEKRPELAEELRLQEEFFKLCGKIIRRLVGAAVQPNHTYWKTAELMMDKNIEVRYYSRESGHVGFRFKYDFLSVQESGYVVKWFTGVDGKSIATGEYKGQPDYEVSEAWQQCLACSEDFKKLKKQDPYALDRTHFVI